jgi:Glycine cleavage system P-protein
MKSRERTTEFDSFVRRHIGPKKQEIDAMLAKIGFENLDALIDAAVPKNIRLNRRLNLPEAKLEIDALAELRAMSKKNKVARSFVGAGYPAKHSRKSWLVHRLHTLPARNRPRPAGSTAQFPNNDYGPDRVRHRERVAAR